MKAQLKYFCLCVVSMLVFSVGALAQGQTITGRVVDNLKEGMPGVNVQVKGTTVGTITDLNGNYSLQVSGPKSVLVFTFIGFSTQEIEVGKQTVINVELQEDSQALEEVVVVGYGTARKGDLTGALTTMRPNPNDASKATSLDNLCLVRWLVWWLVQLLRQLVPLLLLLFVVPAPCVVIISRCMSSTMCRRLLPVNSLLPVSVVTSRLIKIRWLL